MPPSLGGAGLSLLAARSVPLAGRSEHLSFFKEEDSGRLCLRKVRGLFIRPDKAVPVSASGELFFRPCFLVGQGASLYLSSWYPSYLGPWGGVQTSCLEASFL